MKLSILNADLGIAGVDSPDDLDNSHVDMIKKQMREGDRLENFVLFYIPDRDWIVINKNHKLYEEYLEIITCYLELPEISRNECAELAPTEMIKNVFAMLDAVIIRRTLIYNRV